MEVTGEVVSPEGKGPSPVPNVESAGLLAQALRFAFSFLGVPGQVRWPISKAASALYLPNKSEAFDLTYVRDFVHHAPFIHFALSTHQAGWGRSGEVHLMTLVIRCTALRVFGQCEGAGGA